jgi:formylglycine-generating enzyme
MEESMQYIRVIMLSLLALTACGNKVGASLVPEEVVAVPDEVVREDVPIRSDAPADASKGCGECPWDRTCSDEGACVPHPCQSTKDCPGDLVCAQELGDCVHCVGPEDCKEGLFCGADHRCHETYVCTSDKDCKDYEMVCDKDKEICVQCLTVLDCGDGEYCEAGFCLAAVCEAGTAKCVGDEVHGCPDGKKWVIAQTCTGKQYCEEGECSDLLCEPGEVWCEEEVYKVCAADGKSVQYEEDCSSNGKHCFAGACIETVCVPDSTFCVDGDTAAACAADGMSSIPADCPGQHYCKAATGTCQPWACDPGLATCQGSTATVCDAVGSGLASQTDCAGLGKQCSGGQCVDCQPQCQQKECGDDGCGGSCGSCGEDETCMDGACAPKCGDGMCQDSDGESCESCPADCGGCPGLCEPACSLDREECTQAATGQWVCAAKQVTIPAGEFWMGCNDCEGSEVNDKECKKQEHPYHPVHLDDYEIDRTDATANQYAECVAAGGCSPAGTQDTLCTWQKPEFGKHPINCVTKLQATEYCNWLGRKLCTDAQWEKGARGGCEKNGGPSNCKAQSRKYPWGNDPPTCDLAVKVGCGSFTQPVCSVSPAGDSPYGLCDMAGNVWEWVADSYGSDFYCAGQEAWTTGTEGWVYCPKCGSWAGSPDAWNSPYLEIVGALPSVRGGSYQTWNGDAMRLSLRLPTTAESFANIGFRCCSTD